MGCDNRPHWPPLALALCVSSVLHAQPPAGAPGAAGPDSAAGRLAEWDDHLRTLQQGIWTIYAGTAALGPDARGRRISQDLADWVMTPDVRGALDAQRAQAGGALQGGDRALAGTLIGHAEETLNAQAGRLALVSMYWYYQLPLRHQRELLLRAGSDAPDLLRDSQARVEPLAAQLIRDFSPSMTRETLAQEAGGLLEAYNQERGRIAGIVSARQVAAGTVLASRDRSLPCPDPAPPPKDPGKNRAAGPGGAFNLDDYYPGNTQRDYISGGITLRITVSAQGCMLHATVVRSSGSPALDDAALEVSEHISYLPAVKDGQAVQTDTPMRFVFDFRSAAREASGGAAKPAADGRPVAAVTAEEALEAARTLLRNGDDEGAIRGLTAALARAPDHLQLLLLRSVAQQRAHHGPAAHADLDHAQQLEPANVMVLREQALLALRELDFHRSADILAGALRVAPDNEDLQRLRVQALMDAGDFAQALTHSTALVHAHPDNAGARSAQALLLRALHRPAESAAEAAALIQAGRREPVTFQTAASIYAASGRQAEAVAAADQAVKVSSSVQTYLARAFFRAAADAAGRMADIEAALMLEPTSREALLQRAQLQIDAGDEAAALETLGRIPPAQPSDDEVLLHQGIARLKSGQTAAGREDLARYRQQQSTAVALNTFCWQLTLAGVELDQALSACEAATREEPQAAPILDSLGLVLLRLGRHTEALQAYDRSLKARPVGAESLYGRALVKQHLGDKAGAARDLADALALDARVAERLGAHGLTPQG